MKIIKLMIFFLVFFGLLVLPYLWAYTHIQPVTIWDWIQMGIWASGMAIVAIFVLVTLFYVVFMLIKARGVNDPAQLRYLIRFVLYALWINSALFMTAVLSWLADWLPYYLAKRWFAPETLIGYWHIFWIKGLINLCAVVIFVLCYYGLIKIYKIIQDDKHSHQ